MQLMPILGPVVDVHFGRNKLLPHFCTGGGPHAERKKAQHHELTVHTLKQPAPHVARMHTANLVIFVIQWIVDVCGAVMFPMVFVCKASVLDKMINIFEEDGTRN